MFSLSLYVNRNTMEKYVSFSLGGLVFKDSYQFLPSSLATLANNLEKHEFPYLRKYFDNHGFRNKQDQDLLLGKQMYPYSYLDDYAKLEEPRLPDKAAFNNSLSKFS